MKSKKIIVTIVILMLLIVLTAGTVAALYFTTDIFKTNEQIFWKYFSENSQIVSILNNENVELQKQLKQQNSYTTTGDLTISTQIGVSDPKEINISTTSRHDINTGRIYADATLKKEDKDLLKISYINSNNVYSVRCEDINKYYIGFRNENLKKLFETLGMNEEQITMVPDSFDFELLNSALKLDDNMLQHINETYSNIVLQNIPKENYQKLEKETITIDGTNYEANKYALTLTPDTLETIIIQCLTELKNDETTLTYFSESLLNVLATLSLEHKPTNEEIISAIDNLIEYVDNGKIGATLTITVYENGGKTLRTTIDFTNKTREDFANIGKLTIDLSQNQFTLLISESLLISAYNNLEPDNSASSNSELNSIKPDNSESSNSELNGIESDGSEYDNSESDIPVNYSNMQITFTKEPGQDIENSIIIVPDTNNPDETITILKTIGDAQTGIANNSYYITINTMMNDANTVQEITYNTEIAVEDQVEEIMELKDDNSVIINNYPLDQLTTFFNAIASKAGQVLINVLEELGLGISEEFKFDINALENATYNVGA